jgi:hypothetical protein
MTFTKTLIPLAIALGVLKNTGLIDISWSSVALPFVFLVGLYFGSLCSIFHKRLGSES